MGSLYEFACGLGQRCKRTNGEVMRCKGMIERSQTRSRYLSCLLAAHRASVVSPKARSQSGPRGRPGCAVCERSRSAGRGAASHPIFAEGQIRSDMTLGGHRPRQRAVARTSRGVQLPRRGVSIRVERSRAHRVTEVPITSESAPEGFEHHTLLRLANANEIHASTRGNVVIPTTSVEVAGIEPASSGFSTGLLRAQPAAKSRDPRRRRRIRGSPVVLSCPRRPDNNITR